MARLAPLLLSLTALLCLSTLLPVAAANTPASIVETRSGAVLKALYDRREEFRAAPETLHAFVESELDGLFDRDYSARLVLARHARQADPKEIDAFAEALTKNLLRRYGDALLEVDPGLKVAVKSETPLRDGKIMRVATEIVRRSGAPVPVDYLFHQTADGWRAFDVIVEGVSYVQTYRNRFDEPLRTQSLPQITERLASGALSAED